MIGAPPDLLDGWPGDEKRAIVLAVTDGHPRKLAQLTKLNVDAIGLLIEAAGTGAVGFFYTSDGEAKYGVWQPAADQTLLRIFEGSKARLLAAAKQAATVWGRPAPRSSAQVCTDPVLVAALVTGQPSTGATA